MKLKSIPILAVLLAGAGMIHTLVNDPALLGVTLCLTAVAFAVLSLHDRS